MGRRACRTSGTGPGPAPASPCPSRTAGLQRLDVLRDRAEVGIRRLHGAVCLRSLDRRDDFRFWLALELRGGVLERRAHLLGVNGMAVEAAAALREGRAILRAGNSG